MTSTLLQKLGAPALALGVFGLGTAAVLSAPSESDPRIGSWDELKTA